MGSRRKLFVWSLWLNTRQGSLGRAIDRREGKGRQRRARHRQSARDGGRASALHFAPRAYKAPYLPYKPRRKIARRANHQKPVQSCWQKYSAYPVGQITSTSSPRLTREGADRESSRTRGGMRWTRQRRARKRVAGESERAL